MNGGVVLKKGVWGNRGEGVWYKVVKRRMCGVLYVRNIVELVIEGLNEGCFGKENVMRYSDE